MGRLPFDNSETSLALNEFALSSISNNERIAALLRRTLLVKSSVPASDKFYAQYDGHLNRPRQEMI
jgi:hypothetical protein